MLSRKTGATVEQISTALGWQPHTVRTTLTGPRKAGQEITLEKPDGGGAGRYRMVVGNSDLRKLSDSTT